MTIRSKSCFNKEVSTTDHNSRCSRAGHELVPDPQGDASGLRLRSRRVD